MLEFFGKNDTRDILKQMIMDQLFRVSSTGVASSEQVVKFAKSKIEKIEKMKPDDQLEEMSKMFNDLSSAKLPGDFEILVVELDDEDIEKCEECEEEDGEFVCEDCKEEYKDEVKEEEEKECKDCEETVEVAEELNELVKELESVAYEFGNNGQHKFAHDIEKVAQNIKDMLIK